MAASSAPSPQTWSAPKFKFPSGAQFARTRIRPKRTLRRSAGQRIRPPEAPKEALFALHAKMGVKHCVVVQPNSYGYDNSVTVDAVMAKGGAYRGIALVPVAVRDNELKNLDAAGMRGARFHFMEGRAGASIEEVVEFSKRLANIGWHLQIQMQAERIADLASAVKRSAVPVMIDHMGRVDASLGIEQPSFRALLILMEHANIWVKVSGIDRLTRLGPPYADVVPFAHKLVEEYGDRVVWGTDWPHVNHSGAVPDDGVLIESIRAIAPTIAKQQALLVDNPQRFYQFKPVAKINP